MQAIRRVTGQGSVLEIQARNLRNLAKLKTGKPIRRRDLYAMGGKGEPFGIYAWGGCDVRSVVWAGPRLSAERGGPLCIGAFAHATAVRSDFILQTLDPPPPDQTEEVSKRLGLDRRYFDPILFEPDFAVPDQSGLGRFPKDVVVLSVSTDVGRTLYRDRENGFLVDPGGWWLSVDMKEALGDLTNAKWFASNFRKAGRITVEESMANFERIINEIRTRTGAFVVMMNVLTVDPGATGLDYMHANSPNRIRRREFVLALAELAARLDFPIIDVDRLAKQAGTAGQADFVHYTPDQKQLIAGEFTGILRDEGILHRSSTQPVPITR